MSGRWMVGALLAAAVSGAGAGSARAQSAPAAPQTPAATEAAAEDIKQEVARLRREFEQVQQQYGDRLAALERRLAALESTAPEVPPPSPVQAAETPPAEAPAAETPPAPVAPAGSSASALSKVFNPDIAVIGDFLGSIGTNDVEPSPALEMHEAETSFQAVVDPYARADFFISFNPEGAALEEGFLTFTSLPGAFLVKVGKMRGAFGKVNQMHNHVLPWADRPLVSRNLVGGEDGIDDSGISVSRLIFNPLFFLEATGEVYAGNDDVFSAPGKSDLSYVGHLRGYRDLTESTNLDLGTSVAYGHNGATLDSTTRLLGLDATFRYRPLRRAIYTRFNARTELIWSRSEQAPTTPTASSFGYYVSGEYQFARRWFTNIRWDWSERATDASARDRGPSVVMTYWPSEFSQVRGQYRRTSYAEGLIANEFLFQFLFSIGAHGAHTF